MGLSSSTEFTLSPEILEPEGEKYVLKHVLEHLQDRSGYYDRIKECHLWCYFDLPMLWMSRFAKVDSKTYEDCVYFRDFFRKLTWFLYGTSEHQIRTLFKMLDCNGSGLIEPYELGLMIAHLPKELAVQKVLTVGQQGPEPYIKTYRIIHALENNTETDIISRRKLQKHAVTVSEDIIKYYNKLKSLPGLSMTGFTTFIHENPIVLVHCINQLRKRLDTSRRRFSSSIYPSNTDTQFEPGKDSEEFPSFNKKSRRKQYLEYLLRDPNRKGELVGISREGSIATHYVGYQKDDCLYLLGNNGTKLVNVIYLNSYTASKVQGTEAYPFGLELLNVGIEPATNYCFYSNIETSIDEWVKSINDCIEFKQFQEKYALLEEIGKGKFSIVYRCVNKETKAEYAVKVIEKAKLNIKEKELLQNEIAIVKDLHHKGIAKCFEVVESKAHMYIVMEKVEGGELFELLKQRKYFTEFEVVYMMYLMLNAVNYLHNLGIMHRDLKPENVLVELDEEKTHVVTIKLVDFGLSVVVEPGASVFDACGTPAYVAPEVLRRQGYDIQIDMWSLGVIAFLLVRGKLPFDIRNRKDLYYSICEKDVEFDDPWDMVSVNCKDFVKKLLNRDRTKRLTAAQALQHPWIISNIQRIKMKQYQFYVSIPKLFAKMKVDESLVSEMESFEEENVPVEERLVFRDRKGSEAQPIGDGVAKQYEEVDIPEI